MFSQVSGTSYEFQMKKDVKKVLRSKDFMSLSLFWLLLTVGVM